MQKFWKTEKSATVISLNTFSVDYYARTVIQQIGASVTFEVLYSIRHERETLLASLGCTIAILPQICFCSEPRKLTSSLRSTYSWMRRSDAASDSLGEHLDRAYSRYRFKNFSSWLTTSNSVLVFRFILSTVPMVGSGVTCFWTHVHTDALCEAIVLDAILRSTCKHHKLCWGSSSISGLVCLAFAKLWPAIVKIQSDGSAEILSHNMILSCVT